MFVASEINPRTTCGTSGSPKITPKTTNKLEHKTLQEVVRDKYVAMNQTSNPTEPFNLGFYIECVTQINVSTICEQPHKYQNNSPEIDQEPMKYRSGDSLNKKNTRSCFVQISCSLLFKNGPKRHGETVGIEVCLQPGRRIFGTNRPLWSSKAASRNIF